MPAPPHTQRTRGTWLLGWPLSQGLEAVASLALIKWSLDATGSAVLRGVVDAQNLDAAAFDPLAVASDGAGMLLAIALWRRWLLDSAYDRW